MAACAADSLLRGDRRDVFVFRARQRLLRAVGMATEAFGREGQIQGDMAHLLIGGRHVPNGFLSVPIHGGLEEEIIQCKNIGAAAMAGANEIEKLALAVNFIGAVAVETKPNFSVLFEDFVLHAGKSVSEFSGDYISFAEAARMRHGRLLVAFINGLVARFASFVTG